MKFYASVRLDMRRIESIKVGQEIIGNRVRVRVVKNKVAPPFRVAEFDITYNQGISKVGDILDLGVDFDLIEKRGSYYYYDENLLGQGRENAKSYLYENPEVAIELEALIRESSGLHSDIEQAVQEEERVSEDEEEIIEEELDSA